MSLRSTRAPWLLWQLPQACAARAPDAPALVLDEDRVTWAELHAAACRVAGALAALGVEPRDRVGLLAAKGSATLAALYGILRSGAAYVPLDPNAPPARHAAIARDAAVRCVVGDAALVGALFGALAATGDAWRPSALLLGPAAADSRLGSARTLVSADLAGLPAERPPHPGTEQDLAYLLYTSGSTGTPKGVMHTHRSALSFALWAADEFALEPADRVANHAPFHFDLSTFDYFASAAAGATVYPVPERELPFPVSVAARTARDRHTVVYATPSTWTRLLARGSLAAQDLAALRVALYAGEVFPPASLARFLAALPKGTRCWNLYGPTETNVCTFAPVTQAPPEDAPSSIGRACPNLEVFAVDDAGRIVGPGGEGELFVRGGTVMRGYWRDPERTAQVLVQHPAHRDHVDPVYRTGDFVRVAADGSFLFLGRRDQQAKVRGFRVELGEIEAVLCAAPGVAEAAVVALPGEDGELVLCAAVVPAPDAPLDPRALRRFSAERLPPYMVPAQVDVVDDLPRTVSGKLDRRRLAAAWPTARTEEALSSGGARGEAL